MFTMILFDGSKIITPIYFLSEYASQIQYLYPHQITRLTWTGGREWHNTWLPSADEDQATKYAEALRLAITTDKNGWKLEYKRAA